MKRNIVTTCIASVAFVLGLLAYHPAASALTQLSLIACNTAALACTGGNNAGTGVAVMGLSAQGYGVEGVTRSINSNGVVGETPSATGMGNGVFGVTANHGAGVYGRANGLYGSAVYASSPGGANLFNSIGANFDQFWVDTNANVHTTGLIYTGGSCSSGCGRRAQQSYGVSAASPSIEDTGEAQLAAGSAYVRIRPDFANAIDPHQAYLVFLTPESDTRGLYVTQRSPGGFLVCEVMGGRSSAGFAYRIVAQPFGARAARLPFVERPRPQP
ncbi:MAG: hypothetical protein JO199_02080 [Candidatus Eremiobacteraeota bacterium]|nr:hypothetical protein [Candidatus Eremiobacteraeota bacterium]